MEYCVTMGAREPAGCHGASNSCLNPPPDNNSPPTNHSSPRPVFESETFNSSPSRRGNKPHQRDKHGIRYLKITISSPNSMGLWRREAWVTYVGILAGLVGRAVSRAGIGTRPAGLFRTSGAARWRHDSFSRWPHYHPHARYLPVTRLSLHSVFLGRAPRAIMYRLAGKKGHVWLFYT